MILVTGGTGLVGAHLLSQLLINDEPVKVLIRKHSNLQIIKDTLSFYSNDGSKLFNSIQWVYGDVSNYYSIIEATEGVDKVYHSAAFVSFRKADKQKVLDININGTANIVNACLENKVRKICHVSSIAALGKAEGYSPINEENIWIPSKLNSTYTISKFHSEMEVWRGIEEGLEGVIVNPSVIIGPGNWDRSSNALFKKIAKGMRFYPPGATGFVDVRDVAKAMIMLMESPTSSQRYVLSSCNISYKSFFDKVALAFNKPLPTIEVKPWMGALAWRIETLLSILIGKKQQITKETIRSGFNTNTYNASKIETQFGFEFKNIEDTISNAVKYHLQ